ncbi:DUF3566 domain-containing protein [Salinibacterium sp. dk2585]|uniref:DUF3566 domain-containing protein n=1 Tax=unclassified Salinibacterium TaxID=2632331 RepID=UPI0011C24EF1|nr:MULTISPECIES: DUF3566 domain-containing protein [unclassified Salinibacterium]QEE62468.1 DUF3566 domain-containing protein [Salinibacterium sp. dk2585]TXK55183.1 DUF3566 domain-containing protein [Salinibacterium sp. dk5596]
MSSIAEKLQRKSQKSVGSKQVRLRLVYVDFWSAVKLSFLIAVVLGVILIVMTILVWTILASTGIFSQLDSLLGDITGDENFSIMGSFSLIQIIGFSVVVALLNTIVGTALGAIWALIYNFTVRITGGLLVGFTNN